MGSNVKDPNNIICREWAKRLGLSERTAVSHGVRDDCIEVNLVHLRRLSPRHGLSGSGPWISSEELNDLIILFGLGFTGPRDDLPPFVLATSFSFYTNFSCLSYVHV